MKAWIFLVCLLLISVIFISGCLKAPAGEEKKPEVTGEVLDKAYDTLEQELEETVENITAEDIENALLSQ